MSKNQKKKSKAKPDDKPSVIKSGKGKTDRKQKSKFNTESVYNMFLDNKAIIIILLFFGYMYFSTIDSYGMFMWDEAGYANIGKSLYEEFEFAQNGKWDSYRGYGFPLMIAVSFFVFGATTDVIAKVPVVLSGLLGIFVVYFFTRKLVGKNVAIVSAFALAIMPLYWSYTAHLLTGVPFAVFFTLAILSFYHGIKNNPKYLYLSWASLGFAFMLRFNAFLFAPPVIIYLAYLLIKKDKGTINLLKSKEFWLPPLAFIAVVLPYFVFRHIHDFAAPIEFFRSLAGNLSATQFFGYVNWSKYFIDLPSNITYALLFAAVVGLVYGLYKRDEFNAYLVLHIFTTLIYFTMQDWKESRYIMSVFPLIAILAGIGLVKVIYPWLVRDLKSKKLPFIIIILFLLFSFNIGHSAASTQLTYSIANGYPSLKQASEYVRDHTAPDDKIFGISDVQYHWYSDDRIVISPVREGLKTNIKQVTSDSSIKYVILNNHERGQAQYLLEYFSNAFTQEDVDSGTIVVFGETQNQFVDIVIPADLFVERMNYLLDEGLVED